MQKHQIHVPVKKNRGVHTISWFAKMKYWIEEHGRGDRVLLVLLEGDAKGAEIRGSFEVSNIDEVAKWQKAVEFVNTMSKTSSKS